MGAGHHARTALGGLRGFSIRATTKDVRAPGLCLGGAGKAAARRSEGDRETGWGTAGVQAGGDQRLTRQESRRRRKGRWANMKGRVPTYPAPCPCPGLLCAEAVGLVTSLGSTTMPCPLLPVLCPLAGPKSVSFPNVLQLGSWVLRHHLLPPVSLKWPGREPSRRRGDTWDEDGVPREHHRHPGCGGRGMVDPPRMGAAGRNE